MITKTCPNCSNIFNVKHGLQKFCCPNCCRRYWDKSHRDYYKDYYKQNRKKILKYYGDRKEKYNKMQNIYKKDKMEIEKTLDIMKDNNIIEL